MPMNPGTAGAGGALSAAGGPRCVAMLERSRSRRRRLGAGKLRSSAADLRRRGCHTRESLPRLRGRYEMINIKLDKTGGLTEALALAGEAERQEFERMLGCMLCTSRGIAAALPLAPLARLR